MKNIITTLSLMAIVFSITFTACNSSGKLLNKKVMVLGNSITQDGRYVDFLEYYLRKNYPNETIDIISIGLSSETANGASEAAHPWPRPCIHSRLDAALHMIKPDIVLACYGMNDGLFSNPDDERFLSYQEGMTNLIEKVQISGAEIILLTPTVFDPLSTRNPISYDGEEHSYQHPYYNYNEVLRTFSSWLLTLNEVSVINLFDDMEPRLAEAKRINPDSTFVPDGVHPNQTGHFLMAKKILKELYPNIIVPEPKDEIAKLNKDPYFKIVSQRRQLVSKGWRNYIGYTREKVVKEDDITSTIKKAQELELQLIELQN